MEYVILLAALFIACGGAVGVYRMGLRDGQRMAKGESVIKDRDDAPFEASDKVKRMQVLFDNIDAYDGTDKGQVEV